jgi:hypothetical protein
VGTQEVIESRTVFRIGSGATIEEKLIQHRLRWFDHVQRKPLEVPVCSGVLKWVDNVKAGRGRPKLTWDESVKSVSSKSSSLVVLFRFYPPILSHQGTPWLAAYM